jgi:hypothetical protein
VGGADVEAGKLALVVLRPSVQGDAATGFLSISKM